MNELKEKANFFVVTYTAPIYDYFDYKSLDSKDILKNALLSQIIIHKDLIFSLFKYENKFYYECKFKNRVLDKIEINHNHIVEASFLQFVDKAMNRVSMENDNRFKEIYEDDLFSNICKIYYKIKHIDTHEVYVFNLKYSYVFVLKKTNGKYNIGLLDKKIAKDELSNMMLMFSSYEVSTINIEKDLLMEFFVYQMTEILENYPYKDNIKKKRFQLDVDDFVLRII